MFDVIFFYAILFGSGLAIGSFLNVVIFRYHPKKETFAFENIGGRSHCPHCGKTLRWFELIPVASFLVQGGKCRSCRKSLSLQYPVVELLTGVIFAGVPFFLNSFYNFSNTVFATFRLPHFYYAFCFLWILVFLVWFLITCIDFRHYLVPNELNVLLATLGVIITFMLFVRSDMFPPFHESFLKHFVLLFSPFTNVILNHVFGAIVVGLFFAALNILSYGKAMGFGDVKLAAATGLVIGWPDVALATILAFIFGGIWGAWLVLSKRKEMHDRIPFAPLFVLGSVLTILFGYGLLSGYFRLFNI